MKRAAWLLLSVLMATVAHGQQNRISQTYQRDILDARTIAVVAYSSQSAADSQENERSRVAVQQALRAWGKYQVVGDPSQADLIVVVRRGHTQASNIGGAAGTPPVVFGPLDSGTNISVQHGQLPPLSRTDSSRTGARTQLGSEVGSPDDLMEVYLGRTPLPGDASRNTTQYPLDEPPAWSYAAQDALRSPKIEAVAVFRNAVETAEKKP